MRPYSVEIFDRNFLHKVHDMVSDVEYTFDYLAPAECSVIIGTSELIYVGDFIRITNGEYAYFGIVSSITRVANEQMEIGYKPFESVFETTVIFDTSMQSKSSGTSLEQMLKNHILENFVNNTDTYQNINAIRNISLSSTTRNWGFNLKSDKEGLERCIVNLYDVLMIRSMQKYGVRVTAVPDLSDRKIDIVIGTVASNVKTIEADLPNILAKQITVRATSASINKLTVINAANFTTKAIYYLHPDGSYNTSNTNRITPVINQNRAVDIPNGSTWEATAASQAADVFSEASYNNLIELEVLNDDSLVNPANLEIGQTVRVIHDGVSYTSILTGKQIRSTTVLTFGCIRLDLTKIIKRGGL